MPQPALTALRSLLLSCALSGMGVAAAEGDLSGSTLSAPVSPAPVSAPGLTPVTVTVQPGDTAYALARRAGLSLDALLALNHLDSPDLKVGQVLTLRALPVAHTVQPGETLHALSRLYGVSVEALQSVNALLPDARLAVGQVLKLPGGPAVGAVSLSPLSSAAAGAPQGSGAALTSLPAPAATLAPLPGDWRRAALSLLGTPYVLGGTSRTGTDCSGLVLQVFTPLGVKLPRVSADQARAGVAVDLQALQPGDLVFFDTVGGGQVTHIGIYLGEDQFVNANSYRGQVVVDRLMADKYWAPRLLGARRVMTDVLAQQGR